MAKILQLETATKVCSVAISINGETTVLKEESGQNLHASNLTLFIETVVKLAGLEFKDLDAIAVSKGPGSYTGLRIGVSTAKGLCFALDKPLITVDTLKMLASGYIGHNPDFNDLICPMIDARRMEVYTAVFDKELNIIEETTAKVIDALSFSTLLEKNKIVFLGDGALKCEEVIQSENAFFNGDNFNSAGNMSSLAFKAYQQADFADVAYFEPFYLKDFVLTQPKKKI